MRLRNHARRPTIARSSATASRKLDPHVRVRRRAEPVALEARPSRLNSAQETVEGVATRSAKRARPDRRERHASNREQVEPEPHDALESDPVDTGDHRGLSKHKAKLSTDGLTDSLSAPRATSYYGLLQTAVAQEDRLDDTSWLTGTLIDLVLWRLAMQYTDVHFLATDFCQLHLPSLARHLDDDTAAVEICDVLGRRVSVDAASTARRPIVFVANVGRIHWNLLRIQFTPHAELQLFEPMGRLASRSGISYRSVPRCVIEWLDAWYPQEKSWLTRSVSAITRPQQVSGFDCGVACLLYADKCGQGQPREEINASTDQHEITTFRSQLQRQLQCELLPPG